MEKFSLTCKDMGINCNFKAEGESKEEVIKKTMDHAKVAHPEVIKGKNEQDMKKMMEEKTKEGDGDMDDMDM